MNITRIYNIQSFKTGRYWYSILDYWIDGKQHLFRSKLYNFEHEAVSECSDKLNSDVIKRQGAGNDKTAEKNG